MIDIDLGEVRNWFGFGVAGNFAGHLEQAGEAGDFVKVVTEGYAPKGIFRGTRPAGTIFSANFRCPPTRSCCPSPVRSTAR